MRYIAKFYVKELIGPDLDDTRDDVITEVVFNSGSKGNAEEHAERLKEGVADKFHDADHMRYEVENIEVSVSLVEDHIASLERAHEDIRP